MDTSRPTEEYDLIIKAIITARTREGATINEIQDDFADLCGDDFPMLTSGFKTTKKYLLTIDGVFYVRREHCYFWYVKSENSKHIAKLVKEQKPPRHASMKRHHPFGSNHYTNENPKKRFNGSSNSCFFKDNNNFRLKHYMSEPSLESRSNSSRGGSISGEKARPASFYDYQMIGDDFFLELAVSDLDATLENRGIRDIRKSGFCVSGQTIKDAERRIQRCSTDTGTNKVIINIGSVDLLHGADVIDMKFDFHRLYAVCKAKGFETVITTLAPLANVGHISDIRHKWAVFNTFLMNSFVDVVNIVPCFTSKSGQTLFDCFQPMARYVSGSMRPHSLWNRVGRQRIFKFLKVKVSER